MPEYQGYEIKQSPETGGGKSSGREGSRIVTLRRRWTRRNGSMTCFRRTGESKTGK